jgi:hypothetical protein
MSKICDGGEDGACRSLYELHYRRVLSTFLSEVSYDSVLLSLFSSQFFVLTIRY